MSDLPTPARDPAARESEQTQRSRDGLDTLDVALLTLMRDNPRVGVLELARLASVARPTVAARLQRLEADGIVTGYGPDIDLSAAGYPVQAFVTLEIAQGALDQVAEELAAIPGVIEAY